MSAFQISMLSCLSIGIREVDGSMEIDELASPDLGAGEKMGPGVCNRLTSIMAWKYTFADIGRSSCIEVLAVCSRWVRIFVWKLSLVLHGFES